MTHYDVLEVAPDASAAAIRRAYLAQARRHHPDQHAGAGSSARASAQAAMQRVNAAWAVLGDPVERAAYDRQLAGAGPSEPAGPRFTPGRVHPDFVPVDDGDDEVDPRLLDDAPVPGAVAVPRWQQLAPTALVAAALGLGAVGFVLGSAGVLALAVVGFVLGLLGFLLVPMLTVLRASRE